MRLLRQFVGGSPATPVEKELGKLGVILFGHAGNKEQLCLTVGFTFLCQCRFGLILHPPKNCMRGKKREAELIGDARGCVNHSIPTAMTTRRFPPPWSVELTNDDESDLSDLLYGCSRD